MIPGMPRPPSPPHDPRSVLLNAKLGFHAQRVAPQARAVALDPASGALILPSLPSELAAAGGSLGGVRPPSNVALGPDGGIYLLDRRDHLLKRFDRCTCSFVTIPGIGGYGDGPRQWRHPRAIAIARHNLFVCDRDNQRISVFALKGLALRGHLRPPTTEQPWRPIAVTVDSLGRVWVGDAMGKLHRFTPRGTWERFWPLDPAPRHLAIDCRDRVYVMAPGGTPPLRVLDGSAAPVSDAPRYPADLAGFFPRLAFSVDNRGWLCLGALCDAPTTLRFDRRGRPAERTPVRVAPYRRRATYRSKPLDSKIPQCVWHRVQLSGDLPAGARVGVRAFCADQQTPGPEVQGLARSEYCVAHAFDGDGRWDCLVRAAPGRYLWLEILLEGNGVVTPKIDAILVEFPRISLRRFLPATFGQEPVSADFTDRFLALFDTTLRSIERQVDHMAALFDPSSAPAVVADSRKLDFLSWLGSWIGLTADRNWDAFTRRRLLKRASQLLDRRGTLRGLREQLLVLLGFDRLLPCAAEARAPGRCGHAASNCGPEPQPMPLKLPPLILEHFRLRRWLRLGTGRLGEEAVVWGERVVGRTRLGANAQAGVTRLDTTPNPALDPFLVHANQFSVFVPARCRDDARSRKALENLVEREAPAHTRHYLHFVEPRFRIGTQSMLGFDAVVAAVPQGVTLGETPLGTASILTGPPPQGGPAIAVGKEGRVGTTTHLA